MISPALVIDPGHYEMKENASCGGSIMLREEAQLVTVDIPFFLWASPDIYIERLIVASSVGDRYETWEIEKKASGKVLRSLLPKFLLK